MDGTVLVADDDQTIRTVLTQALTRAGCRVHATSSLTTLMRWVGEGRGDAVITDVMMPDGNGLEMLPKIAQDRPDLPVIVISAQNSIMTAIRADEAQAFDYLPKPFDLSDLLRRTARALQASCGGGAPDAPQVAPEDDPGAEEPLVGRSPQMQALYRLLVSVRNDTHSLLLWGESGTGKSLIARNIHQLSDRRSAPLITLTGVDLLAGAGAQVDLAAGGTVVIDRIEDLEAPAQAALVQVMDQAEARDTRILALARDDLSGALASDALREDLYYRLTGAVIAIPPLRDRPSDIAALAAHFLRDTPHRLSDGALEALQSHHWPGNLRELEHLLHRAGLAAEGAEITGAHVMALISEASAVASHAPATDAERLSDAVARHLRRYFDLHEGMLPPPGLYPRILREIEQPLIEIALEATGGNQARCAELLGINRNTLRKKITDLDIQVTRRRKMM